MDYEKTAFDLKPLPVELTKHDTEKRMVQLLEPEFILGLADVLTFGAKKYNPDNWKQGTNWRRIFGSKMRHSLDWYRGIDIDPETGINHLLHDGINTMFLWYFQQNGIGTDDRPKSK
jgi:hypothetical protein